ncbi:MFS transporter [Fervidibacillus albus]|uniref:MFS transporter n=1 Tax=Fervidibacillus albus TaxID=2980026 RepID=A0A9E8LUM3_9BACI|nr:MFS transporter [Fervidibacillus albus]WAA09114.1 MFS transporter [Fervidibacillus albus]
MHIESEQNVEAAQQLPIQRNRTIIVANQFISSLAESILYVAIMWYVYEVTSSALSSAFVVTLFILSDVFLGPFVGVFVDRLNPKTGMHIGYAIMTTIGVLLSLVYIFSIDYFLVFLYLAIIIHNVGGTVMGSSKNKLLPHIVGYNQVVRTNGFISSSGQVASLLGNTVSGYLFSIIGFIGVVLMHSGAYLVASLLLFLIVTSFGQKALEKNEEKQTKKASFSTELKEGFLALKKSKPLLKTVILFSVVNMTTLAGSLIVVLIKDHYNGSSAQYGLVNALSLLAGTLMGLMIGKITKFVKTNVLFISALFLAGIAYFGAGITTNFYIGAFFLMFFAASNVVVGVMYNSMLILFVEEKVRARVTTMYGAIMGIFIPPFTILGGLLADQVGIAPLFIGSGIWLILWSFFPMIDKDMKGLKRLDISENR